MKLALPKIVLTVILIACAMVYLLTVPSMPDVIASQFRGGGVPRSHTTRSFYLPYIFVFGIGMPLFLAFMISVVPGKVRGRLWVVVGIIDGMRAEKSIQMMKPFGWWYASFTALFVIVVHVLLLQANSGDPPMLANGPFLILFSTFMAVTLVSATVLVVRSRRSAA